MTDLLMTWHEINARFWDGRLPVPVLEIGQPDSDIGHAWTQRLPGGLWLIRISPDAFRVFAGAPINLNRYVADTLLHESIHVATLSRLHMIGSLINPHAGHGRGFRREAARLGRLLGLPAPQTRSDFYSWPNRPALYYNTVEIGAGRG